MHLRRVIDSYILHEKCYRRDWYMQWICNIVVWSTPYVFPNFCVYKTCLVRHNIHHSRVKKKCYIDVILSFIKLMSVDRVSAFLYVTPAPNTISCMTRLYYWPFHTFLISDISRAIFFPYLSGSPPLALSSKDFSRLWFTDSRYRAGTFAVFTHRPRAVPRWRRSADVNADSCIRTLPFPHRSNLTTCPKAVWSGARS